MDVDRLPGGLPAALEAILMVVDQPITARELAALTRRPLGQVTAQLASLAAEYEGKGGARPRGFALREVAGGWRIYSAAPFADVVAKFVLDGQSARLTQAALETLAIVAYRQPVTRGQISAIRGVNVDGVVRTLTTRGLIAELGSDEGSGALLYGTTAYFLERMGMSTLDELPPLAPHLPEFDALDSAIKESS
ncbi:SMC-Scp complex subunit ScpB [Rarobacter incanus]|nr:SMC-Scp complex subunit ScpB [Rarobacter incanus]